MVHELLPSRLVVAKSHGAIVDHVETVNVLALETERLVLIDNEERSTDTTSICEQPKLALADITDNRDLALDVTTATHADELVVQQYRVTVNTHPNTVHEHLCRVRRVVVFALVF